MDAMPEEVEAKQAGVAELVERYPHQDRRALAVGRRNRRDDAGWYLPVGVGVEGRNHALCGRDPLMWRSLTSTSIWSDDMSTRVQTPVRVKPRWR